MRAAGTETERKHGAPGNLKGSESLEGGVSFGKKGVGELGLAGSVEKVNGSVNVDTWKPGGPEPATTEGVLGVKKGSSEGDASKDSFSLGGEAGEGLLGGGEVSITKEGLNDIKDALSEFIKSVRDPGPPPPPPPPPPPTKPPT